MQLIRWVRRDSSTVASTAITIADGANSVDPLKFAVNFENLPNGSTRSVLTILKPEPDSSQVMKNYQFFSRVLKCLNPSRRLTTANPFLPRV